MPSASSWDLQDHFLQGDLREKVWLKHMAANFTQDL